MTCLVSGAEQMLAPGDSRLCEKKDLILGKFDQLLRKLGGEELSLNISLGKMGEEWHAAMEGWLDAESTYRLRIEQVLHARVSQHARMSQSRPCDEHTHGFTRPHVAMPAPVSTL